MSDHPHSEEKKKEVEKTANPMKRIDVIIFSFFAIVLATFLYYKYARDWSVPSFSNKQNDAQPRLENKIVFTFVLNENDVFIVGEKHPELHYTIENNSITMHFPGKIGEYGCVLRCSDLYTYTPFYVDQKDPRHNVSSLDGPNIQNSDGLLNSFKCKYNNKPSTIVCTFYRK